MALLRWDPWGELAALQRDVNQLVGRSVTGERPRTVQGAFVPPIDAFTTDEELVVHMELPGMKADDVDISVQDGVLTVRGERYDNIDVKEDNWLRRERFIGSFERSFTLPEGTESQAIKASFDDGILELRIPHPPEQQPRRISISAEKPAVETTAEG